MTLIQWSFRNVLYASLALRIALIIYSEWHDARSLVKYTDVDYRVFTDAAHFVLHPSQNNTAQGPLSQWLGYNITLGSPYTRDTYRYTPLLALLLVPNIFFHPSFGKYLFAALDIINGIIIYDLLINYILPKHSPKNENSKLASTADDNMKAKATLYTAIHLLNPMVFSISTRGSSESVLSLFVLLTLRAVLNEQWTSAAIFLGLSTHWKIYPVIYAVSCICLIGSLSPYANRKSGVVGWLRKLVNPQTLKFAFICGATFTVLGGICYLIWGYPFLYESYLYHLHRLDHRHNFSPYFYPTYLAYPSLTSPTTSAPVSPSTSISDIGTILRAILSSPLTSFLPQLLLSLGTGLLFSYTKPDLVFSWFVQTACFVIFNKVCTSQYFLWYLLLLPLLLPNLHMTRTNAIVCVSVWVATQALWLSKAYNLEFLGQDVFLGLWICGLIYVIGNCWVLVVMMQSYKP